MVAEVEPGPLEAASLPKPELRALAGASPTKVNQIVLNDLTIDEKGRIYFTDHDIEFAKHD